MKKILSLALAVLMLVSALPVAYAAEGEQDYSQGTQITLVGTQENQGAQWTVTVPAKMAPGDTSTVSVAGSWAADQFINVHAPETVTLTYGAQSMDAAITWANSSCGFSKIGSNTDELSHSVDITVGEVSALFGDWSGTLEYTVALIENGDVNRDGMITEADRDAIINSRLSPTQENYKELTEEQAQYADLSGDGTVDMTDAVMVNYIVQGWCEPNAVNAVQPVETVLLGDANGDGTVNVIDSGTILRTLCKSPTAVCTTDTQLLAADINQDGVVNEADSDIIAKYTNRTYKEEIKAQYPSIETEISISGKTVPTIEYYPNLVGDVNGDGAINLDDATTVTTLLAGNLTVDQVSLVRADANCDKVINQTDADMITQYWVNDAAPEGSYIGTYEPDTDNSEYTIEYTETETTE